MTAPDENSNLPTPISAAIAGVPAALVPVSIKALDRLIGAAVDIPVAWLEYQKAKIVSKTEAFCAIDAAITDSAVSQVGANGHFVDRAVESLVRKSYRQQTNKEAVSAAMLEDLRTQSEEVENAPVIDSSGELPTIDDDWLNVFERYAEDASTERMQKLWGRVLAGEVRKPGKYGMRTLRFLSEFSQADALQFSLFCQNSFGNIAPKSLVKMENDIRPLLAMEAAGLIQGASGLGLSRTLNISSDGSGFIVENSLAIMFEGLPGAKIEIPVVALTPLGQELVALLPGRDARAAARNVAKSIKNSQTRAAFIVRLHPNGTGSSMEVIWQENQSTTPVVAG